MEVTVGTLKTSDKAPQIDRNSAIRNVLFKRINTVLWLSSASESDTPSLESNSDSYQLPHLTFQISKMGMIIVAE